MDNPASFSPDKDTTRAIIEYCHGQGDEVAWTEGGSLFWAQSGLQCSAHKIEQLFPGQKKDWLRTAEATTMRVEDWDIVLVRTDPPVNRDYQRMVQLLSLVIDKVLVSNPPSALLLHNEKISALRFSHLMPDTIVSHRDNKSAISGINSAKGVYKSLDSLGGEGVRAFSTSTTEEEHAALHLAVTSEFLGAVDERYLLTQQWIEGVEQGDKRVIMIGGTYAGVILRVPQPGEFRANIHMGATVEATKLTAKEDEIVLEVGAWLRRQGVGLCGLDLVAEYLTEINITSPTGFREIERLSASRPTEKYRNWLIEQLSHHD